MKLFFFVFFLATASAQDVVQVICSQQGMTARIEKAIVDNAGYSMGDVHLNDQDCTFDVNGEDFYEKEVNPLTSCGTLYTANDTHVTFTNSISTVETGSTYPYGVVFGNRPNSRVLSAVISCTFRIDLNVSALFTPNITVTVIQVPDAYGDGEFQAGMAIYTDQSYQRSYERPPIMDADSVLYVGTHLLGNVSEDIHLLMEDCWGTVSADPEGLPQYPLIEDGCPVTSSADGLVEVTQNGEGHRGLWNSPVFKFVGDGETFDDVWLHCDLQICINQACPPTCPAAQRKRRSLGDGSVFGPEDFTTPFLITLGPITRIKVSQISSSNTQISNIKFEEMLDAGRKPSSKNESLDLTPAAIGIIASLGAVILLCFVVAAFVAARYRGSRSGGIDLGDGVTNKAYA